jgi:hypothetical protein
MPHWQAQRVGIFLSSGGGGGGGGSAGSSSGGAVMNSEESLNFRAEQHEFAHQHIDFYSRYLKCDPRQGEILYNKKRLTQRGFKLYWTTLALSTATLMLKVFSPFSTHLRRIMGLGYEKATEEPHQLREVGPRNLAARLCRGFSYFSGGGVLRGLEPVTNADCDRSGCLDGIGACVYTWERREGAHDDEHGREGGHHFGMFSREELERVAGVDEPDGCLCHGCGDWW